MIHFIWALGGAVVGFFIGKYMSKLGFGCPLICDPRISTVYFAFIGLLLSFN